MGEDERGCFDKNTPRHSTRTAFGIRQHLKQLAKFSLSLALGSTLTVVAVFIGHFEAQMHFLFIF